MQNRNASLFSPKQKELLQLFRQNKLCRINILQGAVRSGKTWASLFLWGLWLLSMPRGGRYLMVGKTLSALKRNCLDVLLELFGEVNFAYSIAAKQGVLFGRKLYFESANDVRAEGKIRGLTLHGAYCDELTLFSEDFFGMLLSRLSAPGAKLFATTNPDTPRHWLKINYLNRRHKLNMLVMEFLIDDNPFLQPEYVAQLKKEYTGVFYQRYILGKWVVADGAIYHTFASNRAAYLTHSPQFDFIQVGVDFGGNHSAFAFVACGLTHNFSTLTALISERHPAAGIDPDTLYTLLDAFLHRLKKLYGKADIIYADSAEQTLINGMRGRLATPVRNSVKNPIIDRIRCATGLIAQGRFFYTKHCQTLANALCGAVYNSKKMQDERLDDGTSDIDTLDAFEYAWERYIKGYTGG
ncbi:PBSX family phage terminase large subunit [Ruminococcaceae bacterium OttesenSCG-928-A16]|nr:PBSX family phage terminase large subunit [Ruminococcaceae bacterium OttesenSCG-928-A16]